jgi:recombination protein RecR
VRLLPHSLQTLVTELARLPGVGEKTALRYALHLLRAGAPRTQALLKSLERCSSEVSHCPECFFWTDEGHCPICSDSNRNSQRLVVVRDSPDVLALEKFRSHPWKYHILQGFLSPLSGIGPQQIKVQSLFERIHRDNVQEVILAFDATVEGDATALFIREHLRARESSIQLTRMAMGLPAGASVEYLDASTLENALIHRTNLE